MIRIAIVDDEESILEYINKCVDNSCKYLFKEYEIQCFNNANDYLNAQRTAAFQIIFLDICMPEVNGFELSEKLRDSSINQNTDIFIIYITSNEQLVFQSFDYHPFHFIRKREDKLIQNDISLVLRKVQRHMSQNKTITLYLPYNKTIIVQIQDIEYIISDKHYAQYYLVDGTLIKCREKITDIENKMSDYDFLRIHRSYIVNLKYVIQLILTKKLVKTKSGKILELGDFYTENAKDKYRDYLRSTL